MTNDQQSAGRTPRRFRLGQVGAVRVAAVASALCLAAGMGMGMAAHASAATAQPGQGADPFPGPGPFPGPFPGHEDVLPVCVSFGGILRLALPLQTCNGPIVLLEIASGHHPFPPPEPSGIDTYVVTDSTDAATADAADSSRFDLTADAHCHDGDVATGGGFCACLGSARSLALAVFPRITVLDAPTTNGSVSSDNQQPHDWTAGIQFGFGLTTGQAVSSHSLVITAYVVCTEGEHHMGGYPGGGDTGTGGYPGGGDTGTGGGLSSPAHAAHHR